MHQLIRLTLLSFITLNVIACSPFHFADRRAAECNELNSKMIFSGSSSVVSGSSAIDRVSDMQRAEEPLIQSQYDKKCTK